MKLKIRNLLRSFICHFIIKPFLRYIVGISYKVDKDIFENKQFIIVANHNSHLDTAAILSALPSKVLKRTYPVAAGDYFGKSSFTTFMSKYFLNASLIKRNKDGVGQNPIEQMDHLLKEGKSLIIFPEGSRGSPGEIQEFKKGISILLSKNPHIPFVPVYLDGMGNAMPKGDGLIIPFNGSITFGTPKFIKSNMDLSMSLDFIKRSILELTSK